MQTYISTRSHCNLPPDPAAEVAAAALRRIFEAAPVGSVSLDDILHLALDEALRIETEQEALVLLGMRKSPAPCQLRKHSIYLAIVALVSRSHNIPGQQRIEALILQHAGGRS